MLLTVKEFAAEVGETPGVIRVWCRRGQIPASHEFVRMAKTGGIYRREWRIDDALLIDWKRPTKRYDRPPRRKKVAKSPITETPTPA